MAAGIEGELMDAAGGLSGSRNRPDPVPLEEVGQGSGHRRISDDFPRCRLRTTRGQPEAIPATTLSDARARGVSGSFLQTGVPRFTGLAALAAATEMLAQALAPRTRVNGIAPGLILNSGHPTEDAFERAHRNTLLGRGPGADAIVRALLYLMEADTVPGQILYVDAGKHLMQNHKYLPASGS